MHPKLPVPVRSQGSTTEDSVSFYIKLWIQLEQNIDFENSKQNNALIFALEKKINCVIFI